LNYKEKYQSWLDFAEMDKQNRAELLSIQENDGEIKERFFSDLEFGTAGLRGIIGAGTARMNIYVVRRATQGLAMYILKNGGGSVAIAYDSRHFSKEFARAAAEVLSANGVTAYLYESLRPVPQLSFAVRHLGCAAGIVITASHNPAQYNGYKVYGPDGGQLSGEASNAVEKEINRLDIFADVKTEADDKLIKIIGAEVDEAYYSSTLSRTINGGVIKACRNMKIVYTPFHGSGNIPVREVLKRAGFENVMVVPEQELPDGAFPTVKSPNPENPEGFALAEKLANEVGADIIIGTDPDADRVGVMARNKEGRFVALTGNQTGALLTDYMLSALKGEGRLPKNAAIIKTIVTTEMVRAITDFYGAQLIDVLTGFKYIANKIALYEQTGEHTFILGFEESYGYLTGTDVRDKDAVVASLLIAEMAASYSLRGMSLVDALEELFAKFGRYKEENINIYMEGLDGAEKISAVMSNLRKNLPTAIGGEAVVRYTDYSTGIRTNAATGEQTKVDLPASNVLQFVLADKTLVTFRPSGTEPKLKVYLSVCGENADGKIEKIKKNVELLVK